MPKESQAQMQADMRNRGMRRFALGGNVPSYRNRTPGIDIQGNFSDSNIPRATSAVDTLTNMTTADENRPRITATDTPAPAPVTQSAAAPALPPMFGTVDPNAGLSSEQIAQRDWELAHPKQTAGDPNKIPVPTTPPPVTGTGLTPEATTAGAAPAGTPVFDPTTQDQAALNYYLPRLTASQQAERAAEAQAAMQQGASAETVRGTQAVSDVGRRSAVGEAVAQFADTAATRADERYKWAQEHGMDEREFQWDKDQATVAGLISARDYDGANAYLTSHGMPAIDFTEIENLEDASKFGDAANAIFDVISILPEDAEETTPGITSWLLGLGTSYVQQQVTTMTGGTIAPETPRAVTGGQYQGYSYTGLGTGGYSFTDANGVAQTLTLDQIMADPALMSAVYPAANLNWDDDSPIGEGADPVLDAFAERIDNDVYDWITDGTATTGGKGIYDNLLRNEQFKGLLETARGTDEAAAVEAWDQIGSILGAARFIAYNRTDYAGMAFMIDENTMDTLNDLGVVSDTVYNSYLAERGGTPASSRAYLIQNEGNFANMSPAFIADFNTAYNNGESWARELVLPPETKMSSKGDIFTGHTTLMDEDKTLRGATMNWYHQNEGKVFEHVGMLLRADAISEGTADNAGYIEFTDIKTGSKYRLGWNGMKKIS
jgi:hypothetical protein